jgi:hypothetical protein
LFFPVSAEFLHLAARRNQVLLMNLGFCLSCVAQNAAVLGFLPNELRASASFVEAQLKHDEKHQVMR